MTTADDHHCGGSGGSRGWASLQNWHESRGDRVVISHLRIKNETHKLLSTNGRESTGMSSLPVCLEAYFDRQHSSQCSASKTFESRYTERTF